MRLGGRLQAAIEVLGDIEAGKRPASDVLKDWGSAHRFAGAGDRAVIGNIVYDALRRKLSIAWRMDADDARALAFGALLADGGMDIAAIDAALDGDKFAPETLEQARRIAWESRDSAAAPDYVQADVPEWCAASLQELFGERWVEEGKALATRPPVDLRVNSLKAKPEQTLAALEKAGAAPAPFLAQALRIPPIEALGRHPNVQGEQAFLDGWFEVQDLGSQLAALFAGAKPGEQVLDYCAGAGGKTLALAAAMQNKGQVHAYDAERARLSPMHERLQRAGVRNTQVHGNLDALDPLTGHMDLVLTDAPCTGSGTWRRRPDAKWRLNDQQLERRVQDQQEVLEAARHYVKPGGRLAYVTCSLFAEENTRQVARFLADNPDFTEMPAQALWQSVVTDADGAEPVFPSHGSVFSPLSTGTDGFYVSVMKKAS
ncbi:MULTISPECIES: RsmB/NOP family class I SAM-dependent RNA methyltransferase [Brucella/Ochrobactrum group]|uniref:Sun protein n=1 Tax=Ochrobactrum soli TaxID=2448455 RepID=A0A2P9HJ56_9HYPH|nr:MULTISPECIES: RsmB/NOP family class I SAM-dependent RNA methyltransferase [Brucella]MCI0998809.1 RsmB/NOP family class I SAM-dependent RNA methyltransferase [Ochrobactrum sp. C6C9]RRD26881.1 RsmB/NOP family class I SAM-dependent RNA methyltransferase [Brucellaceae bacterium VT-16-1752]WHT43584.1 RsmB/NOP family class I SAM-dependent RNA methyltransferase [Ochrobactrum sp. SSR]MDX4072967.1 RsmB/NOP family class I SAM-dependent RNA methyltransferase [Brucella sp. NBRC 113783]RLL73707.1 RsmB/N